jgi:hypothetical protein
MARDALQAALGFVVVDAVALDDLVAARGTRDEPDRGTRDVESLGDDDENFLVRPPTFRRRSDAELPPVAVPPNDRRAAASGRDPEVEA